MSFLGRMSRVLAATLTFVVAACDAIWDQKLASARDEGISNPWAIDTARNVYGQGVLAVLDNVHPLGAEFCIADKHIIPVAPHPLSAEKKSQIRRLRAIAWAPCYAARASQFRDTYGKFSEADILAALIAVETFIRSGPSAMAGVRLMQPMPYDKEIVETTKPEKFHGIYNDDDNAPEDWPRGSMEVEFNADPDGQRIDPITFSVMVADGKVRSIQIWRLHSTVEY